jgi:hypothetical protein
MTIDPTIVIVGATNRALDKINQIDVEFKLDD